tara:strand:+ start:1709 stop:2197 length:489 start_codon:yes stop_codon:yes gene_type:complete
MNYALGKKSLAICDRCGFQYKYLQLREEWTGFRVCPECYEPKHPQLEPTPPGQEPQALYHPRIDRTEPRGPVLLNLNPMQITSSQIITVTETGHSRLTGSNVYFTGVESFGGVASSVLNNITYAITVIDSNHYTIAVVSATQLNEKGGGVSVSVWVYGEDPA